MIYKITSVIFVGLLTQIIDSDDDFDADPSVEVLQWVVKQAIITIMNIVKWCADDAKKFWSVLLSMGCISGHETSKHGLPSALRIEGLPGLDSGHSRGDRTTISELPKCGRGQDTDSARNTCENTRRQGSVKDLSNEEKLEIVEQCSEAVMIELGLSVVVALNL